MHKGLKQDSVLAAVGATGAVLSQRGFRAPVNIVLAGGVAGLLAGLLDGDRTTGDCDVLDIDREEKWRPLCGRASGRIRPRPAAGHCASTQRTSMTDPANNLEARWARLGVLLNRAVSPHAPDVERTIIDTIPALPAIPHLIPLVVTWLAEHGLGVARHRLKHLAISDLAPEHRPILGLLLDEAITHGAPAELRIVRDVCQPAARPSPLVSAFRDHAALTAVAESEASEPSKRWGVWLPPVQLKPDAIRPPSWIREHNPTWAARIVRRGDLRASVLESLRLDFGGQAPAVAALAGKTGATRLAVNQAVQALEREGAVRHPPLAPHARARPIELIAA